MINNVNAYLNTDGVYGPSDGTILNSTTKGHLRDIRDPTWSYNELGHCSDYGEPPLDFKRRCFDYLTSLMQYYYRRQSYEADKDTVVFVISHGAVISTLLQMLLNRPVFNEIPLCTPVYFKQSDHRRTVFSLMDYDFDLNKILSFSSDRELFKLLQCPIDMSMMNFENSANELTIGSSDYTTIIQSPPQPGRSRSSSGSASKKPRSNTISLGEPQESLDDSEKTNLRQTRSSKQLHVMNTGDDRSIDLDKLASYFDNYSDSGSGSDEEEEGTDERESDISSPGSPPPQVPRIPSLSSLNALMHTNSAANSIKDMLVDPSATSQTRSSLASAFLMELFGSDSQSPLNDNSSIPETLLSNQTLGGFHLGDEGITDSEDEEDLRSSTTEDGGVLSFGEAKETAMNERKKKVRVFEGTFAKVAFSSKEDEEEDKENGVVEMGKSRSQIMLLSTLGNTKGNDESGVVVQKKGGEELKKILFGSDSSDEDDEWFGSNLRGEPAGDLLG
ncbi:DEKNAAC103940 [Brettanomyces naardenensis]|uniref:DEKNAAC103940 n=1 Tax=Brettanomyces naardenensis TaxID=13370 RepID=A0A448YPP4_BRENA|nr:DEKNAAC103940 [Brettanomyces naardenensis]